MELFTIMAKLMLDNSEYNSGIAQADSSGRALADKLTGYFDKVKKFITLLGIGAAIKSAASAIWNLANQTASAGDAIDKNSQALGMSRKGYQEWAYILGQSGSSIESMGAVMRNLNNVISQNSAETSAALARLGLSAAHLQSLSPEQQFETLVRAFQDLPPSAEKSQLAVQLFGRGAQELMPLLNSSADTVDTLKQRAHDLGLVMSDEDVDAAVAFGDALDDLKKSWDALMMKLGAQLLPGLTNAFLALADAVGSLSNKLTEALNTGDWSGFFGELTKQIANLIPAFVDNLIGIITGIFSNATKLVSLATAIVNGLIIGITEALPMLIEQLPTIVDTIWSGLRDSIENLANLIIGLINEAFGTNIPEIDLSGVQSAFQWFVDNQDTIVSAVGAILAAFVVSKIASFVSTINPLTLIFEGIAAAIALVATNWDLIKDWIGKTWETIVEWHEKSWENTKESFNTLAKWADKTFKVTVNWYKKQWDTVADAFTEAGKWVDKAWNTTVNWVMNQAWDDVSNAFTEAGKWADKAFDTTVNWINSAWEAVSNAFADATGWVDKTVNTTVNWINSAWDGVKSAFDTVANWANGAVHDVQLLFSSSPDELVQKVSDWLNGILGSIGLSFSATSVAEWIKRIWDWISNGIKALSVDFSDGTIGEWISKIGGWIAKGIKNLSVSFIGKVSGWITKIAGWISSGIKIAVNFVNNGIDSLTNDTGAFQGGEPSGPGWGEGLNIPDSPSWGFAKGLNYVPYDGYALIHRGETILNQAQGREWRQNNGNSFDSQALYSSVAAAVAAAVGNIQINMDSKAVGNAVTGQVSRNIYQAQLGRRFAG